jgi:N-acyl-D-aspartate/D-glutamate deacylase
MIAMSGAAKRPLNWNVIQPAAGNLDSCLAKLEVGDRAAARGGKVVGLTMPVDMKARFSFHAGFVLDVFKGWAPIMNATTEEKLRVLSDPAQRARLAEQAADTPNMRHLAKWQDNIVVETFTPETKAYAGRRVGDIAEELGKDPFDTLVDIAIADGPRTTFARATPDPTAADWEARLQIWNDKRAMIGASDAGAHLDMIAAFR